MQRFADHHGGPSDEEKADEVDFAGARLRLPQVDDTERDALLVYDPSHLRPPREQADDEEGGRDR